MLTSNLLTNQLPHNKNQNYNFILCVEMSHSQSDVVTSHINIICLIKYLKLFVEKKYLKLFVKNNICNFNKLTGL